MDIISSMEHVSLLTPLPLLSSPVDFSILLSQSRQLGGNSDASARLASSLCCIQATLENLLSLPSMMVDTYDLSSSSPWLLTFLPHASSQALCAGFGEASRIRGGSDCLPGLGPAVKVTLRVWRQARTHCWQMLPPPRLCCHLLRFPSRPYRTARGSSLSRAC